MALSGKNGVPNISDEESTTIQSISEPDNRRQGAVCMDVLVKLFPTIAGTAKQFLLWVVLLFAVCVIPLSEQDQEMKGYVDESIQTSAGWIKRRKKLERGLNEMQAKNKEEVALAVKQRNNLLKKFKYKFQTLVVEIDGKAKLSASVKNKATKFNRENETLRGNMSKMRDALDRQRQQNKNVIERLENLHRHMRSEAADSSY
ncbi:hypothetical protein ScPMuIL_016186 [Solemya velum]